MGKIAALFLIFVFSISLATAGQKHSIDLINNDVKIVTLAVRDIVVFDFPVREYNKEDILNANQVVRYEILDKEEAVMLREVDLNKRNAKLTIFIAGAETPQYVDLIFGNVLKLDLDRDEIDDLFINVNGANEAGASLMFEKNLNRGEPNLRFYKRLYERETQKPDYLSYVKKNGLYIIAAVLLLIALFRSRFMRLKYLKLKRRFNS